MGASNAAIGTGGAGVILTTLFGATLLKDAPVNLDELELPASPVNYDRELLSSWLSEDVDSESGAPLDDECKFFNFSKSHTADFCDAFTISRIQPNTLHTASERALKCAAKHGVDCILSSEVGLAVPAAFFASPTAQSGVEVLVAPRRVPLTPDDPIAKTEHVRITTPGDAAFSSRTVQFNNTARFEYLTIDKTVKSAVFSNEHAFCLSLLRVAFEAKCWAKLDGF